MSTKPLVEFSFEETLAELEEIVRKLETGGLGLEEGLALYERGQLLSAHCSHQLEQAELKIRQLAANGTTLPFETS